jgi:hypothetical protein
MIANDSKCLQRNQLSLRKFQKIKKSIGFLKLDIFKNVQNRKVKQSFEKGVLKSEM